MMDKSKKKILFLSPSMRTGGAERVVKNIIKNINREKFIPVLGLVKKEGQLLRELPPDIEVVDLNAERVRYIFWKLIRLVRKTNPHVVFSTLGHLTILVLLAHLFMPIKIRFVARETNIPSINARQSPFPYIFPLLYRGLYPTLDLVVCQSKDMFNDLTLNLDFPEENAVVINNPIDVEEVNERIRNADGVLPKGKINVLAAGKLKHQKGFDLLLWAMAHINNPNYHLTILGIGPQEEKLKMLAKKLGIEGQVTFPGFAANPYAYMSQADLFVLSSRFEGFPNVVLEAMACGTPVVAFECPGGINEIIKDGVNGWKVEPLNTIKLASAIEKAIQNRCNAEIIKKNIVNKYHIKKIIEEYEKIFSKVCE